MKKVVLEMPIITKCMAVECAYNADNNCHARAITVGDALNPGCDTFLQGTRHIREVKQVAGIGACKTAACKFNKDFECMTENVQVGMVKNKANCMTFELC